MKSQKKYNAIIDKTLIEEENEGDLNSFVSSILTKGRFFLVDDFHEYLRNTKGMSMISSSACISRIKRIDSNFLSGFKPIDLILYLPFIMSTSKELAIETLKAIKYSIACEMVNRTISDVNLLPNRQYSDCKSAFGKYASYLEYVINEKGTEGLSFQYKGFKKKIPHLSSEGLTTLCKQLKEILNSSVNNRGKITFP